MLNLIERQSQHVRNVLGSALPITEQKDVAYAHRERSQRRLLNRNGLERNIDRRFRGAASAS
ncbi:hypothetical protein KSB_46950 [Ktedonobacter robiniae]|uniref:Uncharacterized protein n=1 Tax=Ktedonobacter robiniae TaxID=2778365 RepID=A0ABQ3UU85_9CHLR|nr:hypothetical protein KSB_46950 [Ktedonobacter robiniae]